MCVAEMLLSIGVLCLLRSMSYLLSADLCCYVLLLLAVCVPVVLLVLLVFLLVLHRGFYEGNLPLLFFHFNQSKFVLYCV